MNIEKFLNRNIFDTYLIGDLHLNHAADFIREERGYASTEDMNTALIEKVNSIPEDKVLFDLGDNFMGDPLLLEDTFYRLTVDVFVFMRGNHVSRKKAETLEKLGAIYAGETITMLLGKREFIFSHFPIDMRGARNAGHPNIYNIHAHTHQRRGGWKDHQYCVSVDCLPNQAPISFQQIYQELKEYEKQEGIEID